MVTSVIADKHLYGIPNKELLLSVKLGTYEMENWNKLKKIQKCKM